MAGTVISIVDGKTFMLKTDEKKILTIRLWGIDVPERTPGKKTGQPFKNESFNALKNRIYQKKVKIFVMNTDKKNRSLSVVFMDSTNINLELIRNGYAWAYKDFLQGPYKIDFINTENDAKNQKKGIWKQSDPEPPWEFRKRNKIDDN
jgi:micrococcal nuclease